jgi:hypothetical protein
VDSPKPEEKAEQGVTRASSPALADPRQVVQIARSVEKGERLAVVRFETTRTGGEMEATGKSSEGIADTAFGADDSGNCHIWVSGNFTLVKILHSQPPPLGRVNDDIPISGISGKDPSYKRLEALLVVQEHKEPTPLILLAVWPMSATRVTEGTFYGPLTDADVAHVCDLVPLLAEFGFDGLTLDRAVALLESGNPQRVWLGLARLEKLHKLTPDDCEKALRSLPPAQVARIVQFLFHVARFDPEFRQCLPPRFLPLSLPVRKQELVLETVLESYNRDLNGAREAVDLAVLQGSAQEWRKKLADDPERATVVKLIDRLLDLR